MKQTAAGKKKQKAAGTDRDAPITPRRLTSDIATHNEADIIQTPLRAAAPDEASSDSDIVEKKNIATLEDDNDTVENNTHADLENNNTTIL